MKSLVDINLLGGDSAVRNRMMNMGHNGWLNADILVNYKNKVTDLTLLESINALILSPYTKNMSFYNMSGITARGDKNIDWRIKYGIPIGWVIQHNKFWTYGGKNNPDFEFIQENGPNTFQPGGSYQKKFGDVVGSPFDEWQDFYFRNRMQYIRKDPSGVSQYPNPLDKFTPVFEVAGSKRSDIALLYWHQTNNMISDSESEDNIEIQRWSLRSYDPYGLYDYPRDDVKTVESSGWGKTNFLSADQGLFLSFVRNVPVVCNFNDKIMDNFTEFKLYWQEPAIGGANDRCTITFTFTMQNHLKVAFNKIRPYAAGTENDPTELNQVNPVLYRNVIGGENSVDIFLLFINGNIVILNKKLDMVATIPVPDWLKKTQKDVLDNEYDVVTGNETRMSFSTYGECYFLASPVLYNPIGIIESEKYKTGEKLNTITHEFKSIIKSPMTSSNIVVITEAGPDEIDDPLKGDIDPESSNVRQEAFYKFTVTLQGLLYQYTYIQNNPYANYEKNELVATDTPILYNLKLFSPSTPRSSDIAVVPDIVNLNIDGINYRKSVDDSGQYNSGDLELSYDMYLNPDIPYLINSPSLVNVGADASFENDYHSDHLGESLNIGSIRRDIAPTPIGLFFVDRIADSKNAGNVFEIKKVIVMQDIIKKFQTAIIPQKVIYDGKSNVNAIMDLAQLANLQGRVYVTPEDMDKSSKDPVLPLNIQGGGAGWVFEIGESVWDCMQRIRTFYGWVMYVDNNGSLVYKSYDRSVFEKNSLLEKVKHIFVDKYNWQNPTVVGLASSGSRRVLPISNYSQVEIDAYKTRVMVSGINTRRDEKILDSITGEEVFAQPGDKIQVMLVDKELEEKLGEVRLGCLEDKRLTTVEAIKQVAKSMARILMRPKKIISFTCPIAELCLDLNLYDPVLVLSDDSHLDLREIISIGYTVRPYDVVMDIECRDYPIE